MGIRISMHLVIGIDDLRVHKGTIIDPRFIPTAAWENRWETPVFPGPALEYLTESDLKRPSRTNEIMRRASVSAHFGFKNAGKPIGGFVQWNDEYGVGSVFAYKLNSLPCADTTLYALAALYPEFRESGYRVLPSIPLEEDTSQAATAIKMLNLYAANNGGRIPLSPEIKRVARWGLSKHRRIKRNQNYLWFNDGFDSWCAAAHHLFDLVGLHVEEKDYKLMLYWQWS